MKKEIVNVDKERGIYKITLLDERWYFIPDQNKTTGLPEYKSIPSVTWITSYVYKGIAYYRWLAEHGWDEAEALKTEAGDKGSKIHSALELLITGASVKMEDKFYNNSKEIEEELTPEEYGAVVSFKTWVDDYKPEFLMTETTVFSEKFNFAGTLDCVAKIKDQIYIIDWKSSQAVYPSMEAQLSAYKQALKEMGKKTEGAKLAILQIGYRRNKKGYKFTEVEDKFESLFLPAQKFWENECKDKQPKQLEYPLEIKLTRQPTSDEKSKMTSMPTPIPKGTSQANIHAVAATGKPVKKLKQPK